MAIKIEMLRYFAAVAEAGNLAKAAAKLGRTPSAVSMMLKQFEQSLGAPLFESDRKSRLTSLGEFVLKEAERELAHFERTISSMEHFALSGEGQVRIACLPGISTAIMPDVVQEMHAENPHVLVWVRDMLTEGGISQIRAETVDIGIVNHFTVAGFSNIKSVPVLTDRFGIVCKRDSVLGRKESVYWSDLSLDRLIFNGLLYGIDNPYVRKAGIDSFIAVESALATQSFVRAGEGISILPEAAARNMSSDLVFRIPEDQAYYRTAYLIWNENHHQSPATLRLCKKLRKVIAAKGFSPNLDKATDIFPGTEG